MQVFFAFAMLFFVLSKMAKKNVAVQFLEFNDWYQHYCAVDFLSHELSVDVAFCRLLI